MSKIDEMLKNEKVEWKKLGDVCEISKGQQFNRIHMLEDGMYPVINGGISPSGFVNVFNTNKNCVTVSQGGASAGYVNFIETNFWLGAHAFSVIPINDKIKDYGYNYELFNRLIFNLLKIAEYSIQNKKEGAGIPSISKTQLSNIKVPFTSVKIQEKIVKFLEEFINHITALKKELDLRNKQYEYYRDKLLSEEHLNKLINKYDLYKYELKETTLGEMAKINRGKRLVRDQLRDEGAYPVYQNSLTPLGFYHEKNFEGDKTCVISAGAAADIFYQKKDFWAADDVFVIITDKLISKYIYYYLLSKQYLLKSQVRKASVPRLSREIVENLKIIYPPIEIQEKIVEILDKFQELTQNVSGLLPDEIEKRQKQYEYYREKLLTFDTECTRGGYQVLSSDYISLLTQAGALVGISVFELRYKSLGNIGTFENGKGMPKSIFNEKGSVGAIHYGHIYTKYNLCVRNPIVNVTVQNAEKLKKVYTGDLVIAKTSENIEDVMKTVAYLGNESVVTGGHAAIFRHNENPKYLSHVFNGANYFIRQKNKLARGVKVIELSTKDMEKIKILIPPKPIQEYIVSILDKFEALSQSTTDGLRREIELREKQYEHYREKLLTFEK